MKAKVLGGFEFKSKNGKDLVNLSVQDLDRLNSIGIVASSVLCMKDSIPGGSLKDMLNKTYIIDVERNNGSAFAKSFYDLSQLQK